MQRKRIFLSIVVFVLFVINPSNPAWAISSQEIFTWVKNEFNCTKDYAVPEVKFVSKEELQKIYRRCTEKTCKKWAGRYGEKKANEMLDYYLTEVIGLCIPKTCEIYVGDFLESCKLNATVAHELTHYLQIKEKGPIDPKSKDAQNQYLYNEMQAAAFEKKFVETYCDSLNLDY